LKQVPVALQQEFNYLVPEGGYGEKGASGASTILDHTDYDFTHCCCAVGTGTMMAGLINAVSPTQEITGISVLKNSLSQESEVGQLVTNKRNNWTLQHDYHFGGYAKHSPLLIDYMNEFYRATGIPSDFVYTAKLFYAVQDLAGHDFFPPGSRLLLIHSGGLQGNRSFEKGMLIF
jgi:1-aminocyclopropane-1-carboxylate deaminase